MLDGDGHVNRAEASSSRVCEEVLGVEIRGHGTKNRSTNTTSKSQSRDLPDCRHIGAMAGEEWRQTLSQQTSGLQHQADT